MEVRVYHFRTDYIPDYIARGNCYEVFEIIEHFQLENSALDDIVRRVFFLDLQIKFTPVISGP